MKDSWDEEIKKGIREELSAVPFSGRAEGRILGQIHGQLKERGKIMKLSKKKTGILLTAAMVIVGAVTAIGAGKVAFTSSSSYTYDRIDSAEELMAQAKEKLGTTPIFLAEFSNGNQFEYGQVIDVEAWDGNQNKVGSFPELNIHYKGGNDLNLSVEKPMEWETEKKEYEAEEVYGEVQLKGSVDQYLFLPPDAEPSEEDKKLEEEGKLMISYGSSEEERKTFKSVMWIQGGLQYHLFTFDAVEIDDLMGLAKELVDSGK